LLSSPAQIWRKLLHEGNFWLGLFIIVFVLIGKDLYLSGLQRNFDPSSAQIVQEVSLSLSLSVSLSLCVSLTLTLSLSLSHPFSFRSLLFTARWAQM
jgi:hypothetical protein